MTPPFPIILASIIISAFLLLPKHHPWLFHVPIYIFIISLLIGIFMFPYKIESPQLFSLETSHIAILSEHDHSIYKDAATDDGHHEQVRSQIFVAPYDMWVLRFGLGLWNAPASTLHHAFLYRLDTPDATCPNYPHSRIFAASEDQLSEQMTFPDTYAVFIPKGTRLQLYAMFHNPKPPVGVGGRHQDVFSRITLHTVPVTEAPVMRPVKFLYLPLSENPCQPYPEDADLVFKVPKKTGEYRFSDLDISNGTGHVTFAHDSTIIYWGAHLHGWEGGKQ